MGSWDCDLAERAAECCRPLEPEPDNTGGGKKTNKSKSNSEFKQSNTLFQTKIFTEIIVFSALSAVLYAIRPFPGFPFGGAVTLGSMVPTMWLSLRKGVRVGIIAGVIYGILAFFIDILYLGASSIIATPLQAVLEYPLAFGLIGLTGIFHRKTVAYAIAGAGLSVFLRFLVHYFVGVFVWYYVYAFPEYGQWIWPAVYNGSFLAAELVISGIILAVLVKRGTLEYNL
jgi:thiamine transporter